MTEELHSTKNCIKWKHELSVLSKKLNYDRELPKCKFLQSQTSTPVKRFCKPGWHKLHQQHMSALNINRDIQTVLLGDSIIQGLSRYKKVWNSFFGKDTLNCGIRGDKVENLLWRAEKLVFPPATRHIVIHCGTNNIEENTPNDIANGLLCSALIINSRNRATNIYITGLLPRDFRETYKRNRIKRVNKLIREKCSSISTPRINYIEQDHDWIDEGNCLRIKCYYRDCLHLVELGNNKLSSTIIKAIKHSNLTMSMNNNKYKATTVLTGEDFPPLSRLSTEKFNPKALCITPPQENTLFSEIVCQTQDSRCNNIISITKTLPQAITSSYMKSKLKAENLPVIKTCPKTARQHNITKKKKTPTKKSQIPSNIISKNIYNNLHHFDNDIIVQVDNGNPKTKEIQLTPDVRRSQIMQNAPSKLFHGALFSYFPGTYLSKRFYINLISKSRSHLIFTGKLFFYALFVGLIFRNYLLSPKMNHGFSGENTTFSKISYKYTNHTKYLPLEVYILSTSNFNRTDHFKFALKHTFQSNNFSQPNHDNEFTFYFIKVALSLMFGLKQFTRTRTKLFTFFLLTQFSISCVLFKTLNQNELEKSLKKYSKGDFFTIESLKTNEKMSIARQECNLTLVTLREMNYRDHTKFFRLILLLSGDINLNPGPTQISKTWSVFKKRGLHFVHLNINSLPSKIEELRQIAKDTNSAVIGLSETKLDKTIFDSEISIPNYSLIRKDRNRKGGGVACYIRGDICFNSQNYLSDEIENISFDLLLPKTKPISIAIVYKPPTDNHFLDYLSRGLNDFNLIEKDLFILGDTNINILNNGENIFDKYKVMSKKNLILVLLLKSMHKFVLL